MDLVMGDAAALSDCLYQKLGRYRYDVFVERLGWQLGCVNGIELDQFDRDDTIYAVARSDRQEVVGCARLLPTTSPYLLGEIFPNLLNGAVPPSAIDVWELSRFAATGLVDRSGSQPQNPSKLALDILSAAADYARSKGAKRLITVSPLAMERLLRKSGFHVHRAGPPSLIDGHPTFACWIELED